MQVASTWPRRHSALHLYLTHSHDRLRALLSELLVAMEANAGDDVRARWAELDHALLSHMEAEERFVLPAFAHLDPEEAAMLLREHGMLREQLLELGVSVDLHCLRYDRSCELAALLERHAVREEELLYRWADDHLEPEMVERLERHVARVTAAQ